MFDFQTMLNGSMAVIQHPAVATFEEHEKNDLQSATIYVVIGGLISGVFGAIASAIRGGSVGSGLIGNAIGAVIGFYIYLGIVYLLGRAFGGTGNFGELAYDISLFSAPITAVGSLLGIIPVLGGIAALVLGLYQIYLTYLGIQSGMNLPKDKAIIVMVIIFLIGLAIIACIAVFFAAIFAAIMSGGNGGR
jgi:Yip1-like protein